MKKILFIFLFLSISCASKPKPTSPHQEKPIKIHQRAEDRIDCNYFWPARQVHVCIKEMPVDECEFLFASGQFVREDSCYCDSAQREKNPVKTAQYIQYDCKN